MLTAGADVPAMNFRATSFVIKGFVLIGVLLVLAPVPAHAGDLSDLQEIVDEARLTFARFVGHPDMNWFREHLKDARAVFIAPSLVKAGYFVGGARGNGVLLVLEERTGEWSDPAFFTVTGGSLGLQIGIQRSEFVAMVMTNKGLESLRGTRFILGADATLAVGPIGGGVGGGTTPTLSADVVSFARSDGAFAGLALQGLVILPDNDSNAVYFGGPVRSTDILAGSDGIHHWYSARLRATLMKAQSGEP